MLILTLCLVLSTDNMLESNQSYYRSRIHDVGDFNIHPATLSLSGLDDSGVCSAMILPGRTFKVILQCSFSFPHHPEAETYFVIPQFQGSMRMQRFGEVEWTFSLDSKYCMLTEAYALFYDSMCLPSDDSRCIWHSRIFRSFESPYVMVHNPTSRTVQLNDLRVQNSFAVCTRTLLMSGRLTSPNPLEVLVSITGESPQPGESSYGRQLSRLAGAALAHRYRSM